MLNPYKLNIQVLETCLALKNWYFEVLGSESDNEGLFHGTDSKNELVANIIYVNVQLYVLSYMPNTFKVMRGLPSLFK